MECNRVKRHRFNWTEWIWKEGESNGTQHRGVQRKGVDSAWTGLKTNICTTLLYHVTPYTSGCIYIYCTLSSVLLWWMRCKQQIHRFDLEAQVIELRTLVLVKKTDHSYLRLWKTWKIIHLENKENQCRDSPSCRWQSLHRSPEALSVNTAFCWEWLLDCKLKCGST